MKTAIIFDCEFLCLEGSQRRFWCAAHDPDPVIAQIGAAKLGLEGDFPLLGTHKAYIRPVDRFGQRYALDPFFTKLTGVTEEDVETKGVELGAALAEIDRFSGGARFWSWGKDELNMIAISCYVAGIQPSIPATRFDNAVKLLIAAGMPIEDLARTPSNKLADLLWRRAPAIAWARRARRCAVLGLHAAASDADRKAAAGCLRAPVA